MIKILCAVIICHDHALGVEIGRARAAKTGVSSGDGDLAGECRSKFKGEHVRIKLFHLHFSHGGCCTRRWRSASCWRKVSHPPTLRSISERGSRRRSGCRSRHRWQIETCTWRWSCRSTCNWSWTRETFWRQKWAWDDWSPRSRRGRVGWP